MDRSRVLAPKPSYSDLSWKERESIDGRSLYAESEASSTRAGIKSDDEWEAQRENLRRVYIDEGLPLRKAMAMMRERYGFCATEKQYKTKIKKWGFQKYTKRSEVLTLVRQVRVELESNPNKQSAIRVRRQIVNILNSIPLSAEERAAVVDGEGESSRSASSRAKVEGIQDNLSTQDLLEFASSDSSSQFPQASESSTHNTTAHSNAAKAACQEQSELDLSFVSVIPPLTPSHSNSASSPESNAQADMMPPMRVDQESGLPGHTTNYMATPPDDFLEDDLFRSLDPPADDWLWTARPIVQPNEEESARCKSPSGLSEFVNWSPRLTPEPRTCEWLQDHCEQSVEPSGEMCSGEPKTSAHFSLALEPSEELAKKDPAVYTQHRRATVPDHIHLARGNESHSMTAFEHRSYKDSAFEDGTNAGSQPMIHSRRLFSHSRRPLKRSADAMFPDLLLASDPTNEVHNPISDTHDPTVEEATSTVGICVNEVSHSMSCKEPTTTADNPNHPWDLPPDPYTQHTRETTGPTSKFGPGSTSTSQLFTSATMVARHDKKNTRTSMGVNTRGSEVDSSKRRFSNLKNRISSSLKHTKSGRQSENRHTRDITLPQTAPSVSMRMHSQNQALEDPQGVRNPALLASAREPFSNRAGHHDVDRVTAELAGTQL